MKKTLFLATVALLTASSALRAQEYKTKLSGADRKIIIEMQGGGMTVEGYDGDEVVIRGDGYEEPDKRAEGLHAVYNTAVDNTKMGLSVTKEGNTLRIVKASRKDGNYTVRVPRKTDVVYREANWNGGDVLMQNLEGHLELTMKSSDAKLLNVRGPVVANNVSGDITVRYAGLGTEPSAISVVSGDVDVTMPANTKASLTLRSVSGEVYTDFDLTLPQKAKDSSRQNFFGMNQIGGQTVNGTVNGGGATVSLKTVSGDIFVRKAK